MPAPREAGAELARRRSTAAGGEPRWWWSAGRRSAPEAGVPRKRIVLWRAPRPKRGRVATSVRVAWPTTPAPPGAPLFFEWLCVTVASAKLGRKQNAPRERSGASIFRHPEVAAERPSKGDGP